jgi:hypothetical protein
MNERTEDDTLFTHRNKGVAEAGVLRQLLHIETMESGVLRQMQNIIFQSTSR